MRLVPCVATPTNLVTVTPDNRTDGQWFRGTPKREKLRNQEEKRYDNAEAVRVHRLESAASGNPSNEREPGLGRDRARGIRLRCAGSYSSLFASTFGPLRKAITDFVGFLEFKIGLFEYEEAFGLGSRS